MTRKKYQCFFNCENSIFNNSKIRKSKHITDNNGYAIKINPNIFNDKINFIYTVDYKQDIDYNYYTNNSEVWIYDESNICATQEIAKNFSIEQISLFLQFIVAGDAEGLMDFYNRDRMEAIGYDLYKLDNLTNNSCFKDIIYIYENIYKTMFYVYEKEEYFNTKNSLFEKYKLDSEILNNKDLLKEYIENLNKSTRIADLNISAKKLNIKPEYVEYIKLYGMPEKAIFDPVLLHEIRESLGLIENDLNQYINNDMC